MPREEFERLAWAGQADNPVDNKHRAKALGVTSEDVQVAPGAILRQPEKLQIGRNVFIGLYTYLNGEVSIGNNILIGPHCSLSASNHVFNAETQSFSRSEPEPIVIGDGSWLAAGCMVTAGVTVGKCNLVCANAVVTKDTPDYAIMAGTPAKQVGCIDRDTGAYRWLNPESEIG